MSQILESLASFRVKIRNVLSVVAEPFHPPCTSVPPMLLALSMRTMLDKAVRHGLRDRTAVKRRASGDHVDRMENLLGSSCETESHPRSKELGERVESDNVTSVGEDLRFEFKVARDALLREVVWMSAEMSGRGAQVV